MAKCNVFRPNLNSDRGTFYTFSQWGDDMTLQNALGDAYRIVPSRFACFNIPGIKTMDIGTKLQDYFEHTCAAIRHHMDVDTNLGRFTPKHASWIFWDAINSQKSNLTDANWSNMVFAGEMDLQGTNYIDGVSYSELYCIVPASAKKMTGWIPGASQSGELPAISWDYDPQFGVPFGWTSSMQQDTQIVTHYASTSVSTPSYYNGPAIFTTEDNQTVYSSLNTLDSLHKVYMKDILYNDNYFDLADDEFFEFNTIVLFYDIVAKNEHNDYHYIYTAVPMGMYVTQEGEPIKKFVSNDDIYAQGTSYGLRVTTKFCAESIVPQTGDNHSNASISASVDELYPEMSAVMDRFNAAAEAFDMYTDQIQSSIEQMSNHISNFKDNKVNVPYIREIKGENDTKSEKYWFVNGRSTGVKVESVYNMYLNGEGDEGMTYEDLRQFVTNIIQETLEPEGSGDGGGEGGDTPIPDPIIKKENFIKLIPEGTYSGKTDLTGVPNNEDYQNLIDKKPEGLLQGCTDLKTHPRLELHNATSVKDIFNGCENIKTIYIPDTISCEDFTNAFTNCSKVERITLDATSAILFNNAFDGCSNLIDLRIDNLDPNKVDGTIDLSGTQIDFASFEYIVTHAKSQQYEESYLDHPSNLPSLTFKLPSGIDISSRSVMDVVYNSAMNKNINVIITH